MKRYFFILAGLMSLFFIAISILGKKDSQQTSPSIEKIIIGTNAEYPPYSSTKNDAIVGFDIDLIAEICKRLKKEFEIKDMPFDVLIPEIQRGSIHIIAAGMTPTPEREKQLLFTHCYFTGDPLVIISPINKPLTTIDQLKGKEVIVNDGYTADFYLSTINGLNIKRLPTPSAAFLALEVGRADAYVVARSTVAPFFQQYGTEKFSVSSIVKTEEKYAFAVSADKSYLIPQFNDTLEIMEKDGSLQEIKTKWGLK